MNQPGPQGEPGATGQPGTPDQSSPPDVVPTQTEPGSGEPETALGLIPDESTYDPSGDGQPAGESPDAAEPDADPEPPAEPPAPESRRLSRAERDTVDRQRRRFAACGRCGYLIADILIYLGNDAFHDAMLDSRDGWVRLTGDEALHRIVSGAYGVFLDAEFDQFDVACPECRRRLVLINPPDGPVRMKVAV